MVEKLTLMTLMTVAKVSSMSYSLVNSSTLESDDGVAMGSPPPAVPPSSNSTPPDSRSTEFAQTSSGYGAIAVFFTVSTSQSFVKSVFLSIYMNL